MVVAMLATLRSRFSARAYAFDVGFCGALGAVGDVVCQLGAESRHLPCRGEQWRWRRAGEPPHDEAVFDPRRLAATTVFNAAYIGGFLHFLYQTYPFAVVATARRLLPASSPLRGRLLDEATLSHSHACGWVDNVHCGVIYIPAYFWGVGLLQGDSVAETSANTLREWWPTYAACTAFWVPYMSANFMLVPRELRVQAMAVGNLAWCVVIDYLAHRGEEPPTAAGGGAGSA